MLILFLSKNPHEINWWTKSSLIKINFFWKKNRPPWSCWKAPHKQYQPKVPETIIGKRKTKLWKNKDKKKYESNTWKKRKRKYMRVGTGGSHGHRVGPNRRRFHWKWVFGFSGWSETVSKSSESFQVSRPFSAAVLLLLLLWFPKLCFRTECAVCFFLRYLKRCVLIY